MLSPPAQLKVDKFPHHEGLSEADGGQHSYPDREGGKSAIKKKVDTSLNLRDSYPIQFLTPFFSIVFCISVFSGIMFEEQ